MRATVATAAERIDAALEAVDLTDLPLARVDVDLFTTMQRAGVPLFPVQVGTRVLACHADLVEAVERACNATDLGTHVHDMFGQAFEIAVDVHLNRCPEHDRPQPG
jgi:hypothetical protein